MPDSDSNRKPDTPTPVSLDAGKQRQVNSPQPNQQQQKVPITPTNTNTSSPILGTPQAPPSPLLSSAAKPKTVRSRSTLRATPVPANALITHQHPGSASHHRQYVLLRERMANTPNPSIISNTGGNTGESSGVSSPKLQAAVTSGSQAVSSLAPNKPRPFLRKAPSARYIFSVDDDEDEVEEDLNREYLEGYSDALRHRFKKTSLLSPHESDPKKDSKIDELESEISQRLVATSQDLNKLRELETDAIHRVSSRLSCDDSQIEIDDIQSEQETIEEDRNPTSHNHYNHHSHNQSELTTLSHESSNNSAIPQQPQNSQSLPSLHAQLTEFTERNGGSSEDASVSSTESFTLRERQDAINETHPFGIRIWKPAIYKKNRSVEIEAENDIHSVLPGTRHIGPSVTFFNLIWSCTFGLLLLILCLILGFSTMIFAVFTSPKKNDSIKYAKLYINLGFYLFIPFGKLVLLRAEKKYMQEDANVGSSLADFREWRTQEEGRLFYASPNAMKRTPQETTPLVSNNNNDEPYTSPTETDSNEGNEQSQGSHHSYVDDDDDDDDDENVTFYKQRMFGRGKWNIGRVMFFLFFYVIINPIMLAISFCLWLLVFTIPMAKVLFILCNHIKRHPLALSFEAEKDYAQRKLTTAGDSESILICTYRSLGFHYYKYTVDGTNIFFINMIFLVIFTIADYFLIKEYLEIDSFIVDSSLIFILCLVSIVPLAYFIGQAVASISAQTSMGVGAVINAFFSTIVEVFLYCVALDQSKGKLVEGSMIGSVLAGVLLLPGTSMCGGAIKRKTQRYNPASAGVSSTMLLYAVFVMLAPTVLYEIYGKYEMQCFSCQPNLDGSNVGDDCKRCHFFQSNFSLDSLYLDYLRPFTIICAVCLFLAYCIGLLFTLKTHAALIWSTPVAADKEKKTEQNNGTVQSVMGHDTNSSIKSLTLDNLSHKKSATSTRPRMTSKRLSQAHVATTPPAQASAVGNGNQNKQTITQPQQQQTQIQPQESGGGHDAPNWSRTKSTTILLLSTLLYAIIAEILVDVVDDVLSVYPISPKLLGLTVFALIPNTTEFVNAISFAMHGNVALSMEIGSAYALQVCLLQIPVVALYSAYRNWDALTADISGMFTLIFPRWDFTACLISVYMFTYIYAEGKSNYFKGSILILLYVIMVFGFYMAITIDDRGFGSLAINNFV